MTDIDKINILLVDDQPGKLLTYEAILKDLGANLVQAGSAKEALQRLLKDDFAVILVDACMPDMDGFELTELVRKHPRFGKTAIILVSAVHRSELDRLRGFDCGAVDYIPVPIVPEILRAKVAVFADLYRKTEELRRLTGELEQRVAERTTELETVAVRLHESDQRYRAFVAASTEAISRWEFEEPIDLSLPVAAQMGCFYEHGRIAECNDAMARMHGANHAAELVGVRLREVFPPADPACRAFIETVIASAYQVSDAEGVHRDGNGRRTWISSSLVSVVDDGELLRTWATQRDITLRKQAEETAKRAEAERLHLLESERAARAAAEHANRIKDDFLATLSHELRTPVSAVLGWAQLARRRQHEPALLAQALETIEHGVWTQVRLINDLLDMGRIASGKLRIKKSDVDIAAVLQAAINTVSPAATAKEISLHADLSASKLVVTGDGTRLQQVFWNVLDNAIKFTPSGGRVDVGLASDDASARVTVRDTGMGIDAEVLPHIFERFWQADRSTVRKHGGLGLGLAIVKYMVERHGGAIQVDSAGENSGTTFVINLPIATAARRTGPGGLRPSRSAVAAAAARLDLAGLRVLLVDDDFGTRDVVARLLEDGGAEVRMASSAHQALQALRERCPDVLISDIGLPEMDGYALIREVRGSDAKPGLPGCGELPALALTAYAGAEARARAFDAGYNAHVVKPVDSDNLLSAVLALVPAADPAHARDGIPASRDSVAQEQRDCALPTSCADPVAQPKTTSTR